MNSALPADDRDRVPDAVDPPPADYVLGCPVWQLAPWRGTVYPATAKPADFLAHYAQRFNGVEGNHTFYGLPAATTVARWCAQTPADFAFCCKLPQAITHRQQLHHADEDTQAFFTRLAPLETRLQVFIQLPHYFGPGALPTLLHYLDGLPTAWPRHVEVRHPAFFAKGDAERQLNRALMDRQVNRVMMDSRPLFSATAREAAVQTAQHKKPRLPVHPLATGRQPMIRFIGHPDIAANTAFFADWVPKLRQWRGEQRRPLVFVHTPDNHQAPALAAHCRRQLAPE